MSQYDCDPDFDASRGEYDDQTPSVEFGEFLGSNEAQGPTEPNQSDGFHAAAIPSVTREFCRPERTTTLSPNEGAALWRVLRRNGYVAVESSPGQNAPPVMAGRSKPFSRDDCVDRSRPGIGLVCGNLDQNGSPTPAAGSLLVVDCDFRLTKAVADYEGRASKALSDGKEEQAARLRKIAERLREIAPTLAETEQSLSRLIA